MADHIWYQIPAFWYRLNMAMTLRLSPEQDRILEQIAHEDGVSKHQATLNLIEEAAVRRGRRARIDAIMDDVLDRDAELLRRLAQ